MTGARRGKRSEAGVTIVVAAFVIPVLFLLVFGVGTVVGMSLVTLAISVPAAFATARLAHLQRGLRMASGAISLAFGVYLAHRVGVVDGLFTPQPSWEPR